MTPDRDASEEVRSARMQTFGEVLLIVGAALLLSWSLARGYVFGLPLWREPRRPGESPVHVRSRHYLKVTDRLPEWTPLALLLVMGIGWLLNRYG